MVDATQIKDKIPEKIFKLFLENRFMNRWSILIIDLLIMALSSVCSYFLTQLLYKSLYVVKFPDFIIYVVASVIFCLIVFLILKTYRGIIRYSTIWELQRIAISLLLASLMLFFFLYIPLGISGTVSLAFGSTFFMISLILILGFRLFTVRVYQLLLKSFGTKKQVMVYIWGIDEEKISQSLILNTPQSTFNIGGYITTDPKMVKKYKYYTKQPVVFIGVLNDLIKKGIKDILFTKYTDLKDNPDLVEFLLNHNFRIYTTEFKNIDKDDLKEDKGYGIRPIQIEDLLGRPEINISLDAIRNIVSGKVILVTGAAGSIGSEIVRQLANFRPEFIICLDQAETAINDLELELKSNFKSLKYVTIIRDIRNAQRMDKVFETYKPEIVFHAAAYKHVPMMEKNPCEAILTNVYGTKVLVDTSIKYNVDKFVMISTDKAVNPTNIMGCTKRIAEIYVQSCAVDNKKNTSNTKFLTTRFGNVLGSNGSVIPLFRKQIEAGGPVTVTHAEITRYFMTIPEACRLVLEASAIGKSGMIYVFDMGRPVKIIDLATRMIELAGYVPNKDIKIVCTGLREGEKLYEELLNAAEISIPTTHEKVLVAKVREYEFTKISPVIDKIVDYAREQKKYEMVLLMKQLVPEFISKNSEFEILDVKGESEKEQVGLN